VQLYGYRPKSVTMSLGCSLGFMLALSVMTAQPRQHMLQLFAIYMNHTAFILGCPHPQPHIGLLRNYLEYWCSFHKLSILHSKAQIPLGSTRLDSTRSTLSSQSSKSRQACRARRAVLFQHGGRRTILYKFSRFYALAYTNPICFIK